jgi:molybdopterin converting factor small subunit
MKPKKPVFQSKGSKMEFCGREWNEPSRVAVQIQLHGFLKTRHSVSPMMLEVSPLLHDALQEIREHVPGLDENLSKGSVLVLVNGINLQRISQPVTLTEGDTIAFVPFVAGGLGH